MPLRRALLAGVLAAILCAAPAAALEPSPAINTLDTVSASGITIDGCGLQLLPNGGFDGGAHVRADCRATAFAIVSFTQPQALVELYVRRSGTQWPETSGTIRVTACDVSNCDPNIVAQAVLAPPDNTWVPVVLGDPAGTATIRSVSIYSDWLVLDVDDIGASATVNQPDTEITAAPPATTSATTASFAFRANQPGAAFTCTFAAAAGCASPASFPGLSLGAYRFSVAARDRWGRTDPTPASTAFTVVAARRGRRRRPRRVRQLPVRREPGPDGHRRRQDRRRLRGAAAR